MAAAAVGAGGLAVAGAWVVGRGGSSRGDAFITAGGANMNAD